MNIIFSICSNNYLAQAIVLFNSINKIADKKYFLYLCVADKKMSCISYEKIPENVNVIFYEQIECETINKNIEKYNIIEFNTSLKATFFKFLVKKNKNAKNIIYLDPDIKVYNTFDNIFHKLVEFNIVLTPHILTPIISDSYEPQENLFLNYGLYNLGFIAITINLETVRFLDWWEEHLLKNCFQKVSSGIFVDQLWINLVPIFFEKVLILTEFGYNMAPWNLHERKLTYENDQFILNDGSKLTFYHFSDYNFKYPQKLSNRYYKRYDFSERSDLVSIYSEYQSDLISADVDIFSQIQYSLTPSNQLPNSEEYNFLFRKLNFLKKRLKR